MEDLNLKHLFDGELTPLSLGRMSMSSALFTAYHLLDEETFTMVTLVVDKINFSALNIMGVPVFFEHDIKTDNLEMVKNIEKELVEATEETSQYCEVIVSKEVVAFNNAIDDITTVIKDSSIFDEFISQAIDNYEEDTNNEDDYEDMEDIVFKNIEVFDGNKEFHLDVTNPQVQELLDDALDIDDEISELIEMAQNMLEEANYISKNGYAPEDDEYHWDITQDEKFKDEDFYWETTLEEDEEMELDKFTFQKESVDYVDKEVSKMENEKVDKEHNPEFEERMNNMLEFMLSQSSAGHEPNYKFEHSKKGEELKYEDSNGKFLMSNVDLNTRFDSNNHIIVLKITREKDGVKEVSFEESELNSEFTMSEVIQEVKTNSKYLKGVKAELDSMKTKSGKTVWESKK